MSRINKILGGEDKSGAWNEHTCTTVCKIDNQQGPTVHVQHRELYLIFWANQYEKRIQKRMNTVHAQM